MKPIARKRRGKRKSKLWERHPLDWYIEPSWVSASIFAVEKFEGKVWDPAAGIGRIPTAAKAAGLEAVASDIEDRGCADFVGDFLKVEKKHAPNIVSNIPFGIAPAFVVHALQLAERKVAMLLPGNWLQGERRSRWIEGTPLRRVYFLSPRPSMPPGPVVMAGIKPGNGQADFAWYVWLRGYDGYPEIRWIRRGEHVTEQGLAPAVDQVSVFMGPEEQRRHSIKALGKLEKVNGLPLFSKPAVTRDGKGAKA